MRYRSEARCYDCDEVIIVVESENPSELSNVKCPKDNSHVVTLTLEKLSA